MRTVLMYVRTKSQVTVDAPGSPAYLSYFKYYLSTRPVVATRVASQLFAAHRNQD